MRVEGMVKVFFIIRELLIENRWYIRPIWHLLHFLYRMILLLNGSLIHLETKFSGTPIFVHGLKGIIISRDSVIGKNVVIYQQVTIGWIEKGNKKGAPMRGNPVIEDNVLIGAGAKIMGGITIGAGAKIGPNCVVVDDVPAHAVVFVDKPKMILKKTLE